MWKHFAHQRWLRDHQNLCQCLFLKHMKFKFLRPLRLDLYPGCSEERKYEVSGWCLQFPLQPHSGWPNPERRWDVGLSGHRGNTCMFTHHLFLCCLGEGLPGSLASSCLEMRWDEHRPRLVTCSRWSLSQTLNFPLTIGGLHNYFNILPMGNDTLTFLCFFCRPWGIEYLTGVCPGQAECEEGTGIRTQASLGNDFQAS